jgi:uncharacterized oligopeptide transporter (OPT) family protein
MDQKGYEKRKRAFIKAELSANLLVVASVCSILYFGYCPSLGMCKDRDFNFETTAWSLVGTLIGTVFSVYFRKQINKPPELPRHDKSDENSD